MRSMIGVFDSGYGGLTVFRELDKKFPEYDLVYFGDNARTPYGSRSAETIYQYTREAVGWLFGQGCKLAILACNTASSAALRRLQKENPERKVLGVLIPVAEAIATSGADTVGILATQATVKSGAYLREIHKISPEIKIVQQAAPSLVPLIEGGVRIYHNKITEALKIYLEPFKKECVKNLVLGCTHYPLIKDLIAAEMPEANIFDSPSVIPPALENYLFRHQEIDQRISKQGRRHYFTTSDPTAFSTFAKDFLKIEIASEKIIL